MDCGWRCGRGSGVGGAAAADAVEDLDADVRQNGVCALREGTSETQLGQGRYLSQVRDHKGLQGRGVIEPGRYSHLCHRVCEMYVLYVSCSCNIYVRVHDINICMCVYICVLMYVLLLTSTHGWTKIKYSVVYVLSDWNRSLAL